MTESERLDLYTSIVVTLAQMKTRRNIISHLTGKALTATPHYNFSLPLEGKVATNVVG